MVFPQWNPTTSELDWIFSMEESILIDKDFQSRVNYEWHSSDFGLNSLLEIEDDSIKTCKKIVSGASLRNAGDY